MCAGAIYWAGIDRVVYALGSDMLAAIVKDLPEDSTLRLPCREVFARGGRRVEVSGPHLVEQASAVHAGFWD
jgi:tRNA(Arg) A34 adenosine deaminase TadA